MATAVGPIRHILLTGPPGIGKTTLIRKTVEKLTSDSINVQGFYTEEVRGQHGKRVGFDVITLDGKKGTLATVSQEKGDYGGRRREYRVGQYIVDLLSFEEVALPVLRTKSSNINLPVYVIDEIGKMEMFSDSFKHEVKSLLNKSGSTVLATIPMPKGRPIPFVEEIRNRTDVNVITVTRENRDNLLVDIVDAVMQATCR
ncbi:cancer-related nucleoside-triphosphatase-like [Glandiceps talaboti]